MKTGLVLEGGGLRGIYTAGALDCFMDEGIWFPYCIGVSAGACNGASYLSGQRGRSYRIDIDYIRDPRYISLRNFVRTRSLFGMDFLFREVPERLDPFDYDAFFARECQLITGVTNVATGKPCYFSKEALRHDVTVLKASSSIPVFSPMVPYRGGLYLDGGTSDPIPVRKALADGCEKLVVIRTRHRDYVKQPEGFRRIYRRAFRDYPAMIHTLDIRHKVYNDTVSFLGELESQGKAFVLAPREKLPIDRFERDPKKLDAVYHLGYNQTKELLPQLRAFLEAPAPAQGGQG